jgi:(4S)-4-hydroxy-5-phosphonooxypentane-2,3-dione isomerase
MHVTLVQIQIKPEFVEQFIAATRENHMNSVREPGNRRFDVLQSADDPTRFALYEAYAGAADAAAHKNSVHYLRWRDTVALWMAAPRTALSFQGLMPAA